MLCQPREHNLWNTPVWGDVTNSLKSGLFGNCSPAVLYNSGLLLHWGPLAPKYVTEYGAKSKAQSLLGDRALLLISLGSWTLQLLCWTFHRVCSSVRLFHFLFFTLNVLRLLSQFADQLLHAKHCKKCFTYTAGNTARFIFHLTRYLVNTKESLKEAVRYDSKFSGSLNLQVSRNLPQLYVLFSYQCVPSL